MERLLLRKCEKSTNTLYVPKALYKKWSIYNDIPHSLCFGAKIISCNILPHEQEKNEYHLSLDSWEELQIPFENEVHLIEKDKTLYIGPLVGIFTAGFITSPRHPLGERSAFFAKLLLDDEPLGGYYFVFGQHLINWEKAEMEGYFFQNQEWKKATIPFPNVIYDRLPNRKTEQLEPFQLIKNKFQDDYLIPLFNPGFFDKWTVYTKLLQSKTCQRYLPKTLLNPSLEEIDAMLKEFGQVFIKPVHGSHGEGIQQLIKPRNEAFYYCRFQQNHQNHLRRFSNLKRLMNHQFSNGLENMIGQQGINLITLEHKPVDFRIHTNKDRIGNWKVSAIAAKKAGEHSITTHVANGGEVKTIKEMISLNILSNKQFNQLKNIALQLSEEIDRYLPGLIGEIGFDLGLDKNGNIWLFEANSKPGRTIFSYQKLNQADKISRRLPLDYAYYLAKEAIHRPDKIFLS